MFEISNIGIATALAAGAISFLSPCVLPLVPGYISYVAGNTHNGGGEPAASRRLLTLALSLYFVLGFSTVFVLLGASATALGRLLLIHSAQANVVGGAVVIAFGAFMTGLIPIPWLQRDLRLHTHLKGGRPIGALLLGAAFGFGWTPCIGPVLGAILTVSAVSATAKDGMVLLGVYSLGLGLPFLLSALFTDGLAGRLKRMRRAGRVLEVGAGVVMIAMGAAMATGTISTFSFWLLQQFPIFTQIG